jgi:glycosyltransferase involved in cell wall biosynthesis
MQVNTAGDAGAGAKVSVIVPAYNVERYLSRCVGSLLHQDHANIEVILVDDGSPDGSGELADRLAESDARVRVIHKANGGVSSARNAGIDAAGGDWVMFVDGDDWVEPDYVSYFLSLVCHGGCLVGMDTRNCRGDEPPAPRERTKQTVPAERALEWIYDDTIFVAVWNKIYSAQLLHDLRFSEDVWYGEGMLFNVEALQLVDTVAVGDAEVYHQTFNPDSAMRCFSLKSNYCGIASLWLQRAEWDKVTPAIEREWRYHRYRFNRSIVDGLGRAGLMDEEGDAFRECVRNLRRDLPFALGAETSPKQRVALVLYALAPKAMARRSARKFLARVDETSRGGVAPRLRLIVGHREASAARTGHDSWTTPPSEVA